MYIVWCEHWWQFTYIFINKKLSGLMSPWIILQVCKWWTMFNIWLVKCITRLSCITYIEKILSNGVKFQFKLNIKPILITLVVDWRIRLLMSSNEPNWENSVTKMLAFGAIIADEISIKPSNYFQIWNQTN